MAFPDWAKSRYLTGNQTIDRQHEELFEKMNQLLEAMSVGEGRGEVESLFSFLETYVEEHFALEEELTPDPHSSIAQENVREHRAFAQKLSELKEMFKQDGSSSQLAIRMQKGMANWLEHHIKDVDAKLQLPPTV